MAIVPKSILFYFNSYPFDAAASVDHNDRNSSIDTTRLAKLQLLKLGSSLVPTIAQAVDQTLGNFAGRSFLCLSGFFNLAHSMLSWAWLATCSKNCTSLPKMRYIAFKYFFQGLIQVGIVIQSIDLSTDSTGKRPHKMRKIKASLDGQASLDRSMQKIHTGFLLADNVEELCTAPKFDTILEIVSNALYYNLLSGSGNKHSETVLFLYGQAVISGIRMIIALDTSEIPHLRKYKLCEAVGHGMMAVARVYQIYTADPNR